MGQNLDIKAYSGISSYLVLSASIIW